MSLQSFLNTLEQCPEHIDFDDTMAIIDSEYLFTPTAFQNGLCQNEAGQNNGSCKILSFGLLHDLSVEQTLACFGKFYRDDVLSNPNGDSHQNIRNFMKTGWSQVSFNSPALAKK